MVAGGDGGVGGHLVADGTGHHILQLLQLGDLGEQARPGGVVSRHLGRLERSWSRIKNQLCISEILSKSYEIRNIPSSPAKLEICQHFALLPR